MNNIWTFSPTSQELLLECLSSASTRNSTNKWYRELGQKPFEKDLKCENREENNDNTILCDDRQEIQPSGVRESEVLGKEIDEIFIERVESDPVGNFEQIVEECMKDKNVLAALAYRLSSSAVEKFFNHVFNTTNCNIAFIELVHKILLHKFLKQNQSWLSLELLVKSYKTYPDVFMELFKDLLQDIEVPSKLLQDFIATLNDEEKCIFLNHMIRIEFNKEQCKRRLQLYFTTYKECKKNVVIQNYIESIIMAHSQDFLNDKVFGKFLLTFLQAQVNIGCFSNSSNIEKVIENHRTPFKKPCLNFFKEVIDKYK